MQGVFPDLLQNLKWLVDKTDAKIVLISSWKHSVENKRPGGLYLVDELIKAGTPIYDTTEHYEKNSSIRGRGILNYLSAHSADNYVILDDELFDYIREPELFQHLVLINEHKGFTKEDARTAYEIIKEY